MSSNLLILFVCRKAEKLSNSKIFLNLAALEFRADFNRPNLFYEVLPKSSCSDTFVNNIVSLIKDRFGSQSGIIYCFSRKECENLAKTLRSYFPSNSNL